MKTFFLILILIISTTVYSQTTSQSVDNIIDASNKTQTENYNQLLSSKFNSDFYNTTLLIVDGIKMKRIDNRKHFSALQSKIKKLDILVKNDDIKKYTKDSSILRIFLATTK